MQMCSITYINIAPISSTDVYLVVLCSYPPNNDLLSAASTSMYPGYEIATSELLVIHVHILA